MMLANLFESEKFRMGGFDLENDAEIEAGWSYDLTYARWYRDYPLRPLTAFEIKKRHEEWLKEMRDGNSVYHFSLRSREDNRLVGFVRISEVYWLHRLGTLQVALGDPACQGLLTEAILLGLRYGFEELNLHRLSIVAPGYDLRLLEACESAGLTLEVRQRRMTYFANSFWDLLRYGMLCSEWRAMEGQHE